MDRYQVSIQSIDDLSLLTGVEKQCVTLLDFDPLKMNAVYQSLEDLGSCLNPLIVIASLPDILPDSIHDFNPARIMQKPVDSDELIEVIDTLTKDWEIDIVEKTAQTIEAASSWVEDVQVAARNLAQLSLETYAQAALVARNGSVWAYAGQLLQAQAEELVGLIYTHWEEGSNSDLARYVILGSNGKEYLLYATAIQPGYVLALAFDAQLPFGEIRAQASAFAKKMARVDVMMMAGDQKAAETPSEDRPGVPFPDDWLEDDVESEDPSQAIEEILSALEIQPEMEDEFTVMENESAMNEDPPEIDDPALDPSSSNSIVDHHQHQRNPSNPQGETDPNIPLLELKYCGMLITRLPDHRTNPYLKKLLSEWLPRLCLAYGWVLNDLLIEDEAITWVISTLGREAPIDLVSIIRTKLSERIFRVFPSFHDENPSGDFWAVPYFLMTANQYPPADVRMSVIRQIRKSQGM